jgi:hypothetical protein
MISALRLVADEVFRSVTDVIASGKRFFCLLAVGTALYWMERLLSYAAFLNIGKGFGLRQSLLPVPMTGALCRQCCTLGEING